MPMGPRGQGTAAAAPGALEYAEKTSSGKRTGRWATPSGVSNVMVTPEVASAAVAGLMNLSAEYRPPLCRSKRGAEGFPLKRTLVMVFLLA